MSTIDKIHKYLAEQPPNIREQLRLELLAESAKEDLGAYGTYLFDTPSSPHRPAPHHEEWIEVLNDPTAKRVFIASPRGGAKTSWIGNAFPGWAVGNNKNLRIGYVSASEGQAESVSLVNKGLIDGNERYKRVFPDVQPDLTKKWTNTIWYVKREIIYTHPTFFATGIGGAILGKRFDLLIMDDVCDQKNMESDTLRRKTREWIEATLIPCMTDSYVDGVKLAPRIVIICTRWHEEDVYKVARDMGGFEFLIQPALGHWERKKGIIIVPDKEKGQMENYLSRHDDVIPKTIRDKLDLMDGFMDVDDYLSKMSNNTIKEGSEENENVSEDGDVDNNDGTDTGNSDDGEGNVITSTVLTEEEVGELSYNTQLTLNSVDGDTFRQVRQVRQVRQPGQEGQHVKSVKSGNTGNTGKSGNPVNTATRQRAIIPAGVTTLERGGSGGNSGGGSNENSDNNKEGPYYGRMAMIAHGSALWPEKRTREEHLQDYKRNQRLFWKMSMQEPSSPAGNIFQRHWWSFFNKQDTVFRKGDVRAIVYPWDTAFTKSSGSDYSVGYEMVLGADMRIYVTREIRGQFTFPELKKAVTRFYFQSPVRIKMGHSNSPVTTAVVIEHKGSGISVMQSLQAESTLPVFPSAADTDKETRANAVSWMAEAGRFVLPDDEADMYWVEAFIDELAEFPNSAHDDRVDAFVHGANFIIEQQIKQDEENMMKTMEGVIEGSNPYSEWGLEWGGGSEGGDTMQLLENMKANAPGFNIYSPFEVDLSDPFKGGL